MTLAEYRRSEAAANGAQAHSAPGERPHPTPVQYGIIGLTLSVITAIEVGIYYVDMPTPVLVTSLLLLSGFKFTLVMLWFMHLRFDSRLFSILMVAGLALAFALFMVVLSTLDAGLV